MAAFLFYMDEKPEEERDLSTKTGNEAEWEYGPSFDPSKGIPD